MPDLNFEKLIGAALALIAIIISIDVLGDFQQGISFTHILLEGLIFLICLLGLSFLVLEYRLQERARSGVLQSKLEKVQNERDHWRESAKSYLSGLGNAIERQFSDWQLSPSEREIGFLILKGLSHKEIAAIRQTGEKTVRQQATMLYAKAGLNGKAELLSFFLEDLMAPQQEL